MLEAGVDLTVVSRALGHSTISTTADLSSHISANMLGGGQLARSSFRPVRFVNAAELSYVILVFPRRFVCASAARFDSFVTCS